MTRLRVQTVDHAGAREIFPELSKVHAECFPDDVPTDVEEESADAFFDRVTWLHEETEATWFLLREVASTPEDEEIGALIGFACGYKYADSWYGAHLGVIPRKRKRGYGSYLMRISQAHAADLGIRRLQASVEVDPRIRRGRLLRYYIRHGAKLVNTGIGSAGSAAGSVVRIERHFTPEIAQKELARSRDRVLNRRFAVPHLAMIAVAFGVAAKFRVQHSS